MRVVCGKGNNGGDGLVAARRRPDEAMRLRGRGRCERRSRRPSAPADLDAWLAGSGAVVDAIFGTGFAGAPREPAAAAIEAINRCGAPVVACDVASGVDASSGEVEGAAVEADLTVSFHAAKLGHRIAPGKWHTGELRVVADRDPRRRARRARPRARSTPRCSALAPRRGAGSTKFSSGQVVVAGGSRGLTGAVQMASLAAIRAGAGYATVAVPADLEAIFEAGQPEVMSVGCPGGDGCLAPASPKALLRAFERAAAGVLGPGLGRDPGSVELAREARRRDRGAAGHRRRRPQRLRRASSSGSPPARRRPILTPHAGELGRLLGRSARRRSRRTGSPSAREAAGAAGAVVVLKGDDTIVTDGERVAVNALSAPALATAGTGDVLSGHRRRAARPRPRAVRRRLRRGPRPRPRRSRRGAAGSAPPSR